MFVYQKNKSGILLSQSNISAKIVLLLTIGVFFYACNELQNPVSDLPVIESYTLPGALATGVNTGAVVINNFTIAFNGVTYNSDLNTSEFSYTVSRGGDGTGFNYMEFEVPSCTELKSYTPSEASSFTGGRIRWTNSIGANSSRNYKITYYGKPLTGMVDATIQASGTGDIETKLIPGPCKGVYSISGVVYVDENGNGTRNSGEGGIGNVTVQLGVNGDIATKKTSSGGEYSFNIYTGDKETGFTLSVPALTNDATDFNEFLFETYSPKEGSEGISGNITSSNVSGMYFGFEPKTQEIIEKFEAGDEIILKTEVPSFWADEVKFSTRGRNTVFTKSELISFLAAIDKLELTYKFNFGTEPDARLKKAEEILTLKRRSSALEVLQANLLAAKLNVVSGNGAFDENGNVLADFNLLILKTGAAAARELDTDYISGSVLLNSAVLETSAFTATASSTLSSGGDLLTSFNGSGGGIGK